MRGLSRDEAAALVRFGPVPNGRVWFLLGGIVLSIGLVVGLAKLFDDGSLLPLAGPAMLVSIALYFVEPVLRQRRARFVVKNGERVRGRVVGQRRVGTVGAAPASPLLELTIALTTPDGNEVEATTLLAGNIDPRLNEQIIGRERWFYWRASQPRVAVPEEQWRLTSALD